MFQKASNMTDQQQTIRGSESSRPDSFDRSENVNSYDPNYSSQYVPTDNINNRIDKLYIDFFFFRLVLANPNFLNSCLWPTANFYPHQIGYGQKW